jgi:hypothetical protein
MREFADRDRLGVSQLINVQYLGDASRSKPNSEI